MLWVSYPTFFGDFSYAITGSAKEAHGKAQPVLFHIRGYGRAVYSLKTDLRVDVFIRNFLDISSMVNLFSTLSVKKSLISFYKLGLPGNVLGKSGFGRRLKAYKIKQYLLCLKPIIGHF